MPRRVVVASCDLAQLALCAALAALLAAGALSFSALLAFAVLFGLASGLAMPAMMAFLPETVPRDDHASASSLYNGARTLALILGASLGGALIASAGTSWAFAVDGASFGVSAACVLATSARPSPCAGERGGVLADAREGARYVARVPWIWIAIVVSSIYNLVEVGPRNVGIPFLLTGELAAGARALGFVNAATGAGGFAAALAAGAWVPRARRGVVAYASAAVGGLVLVGWGLSPSVAWVVLLSFVRGACFATFAVLYETSIGEQVDAGVRGRVASLDLLGSFALLPLSPAVTGWLIEGVGVRGTFVGAGAIVAWGTLVPLLVPRARRFEVAPSRD